MKYLKWGLLFCIFMLLILPTSSLAENVSPTVEKKKETVGRVTLESKEYPLDHYKLEADIGDGIKEAGDRALHAINQGLWGFNKTIANFTLYSVDQLMSFDLISLIVNEAGMMSERIYKIISGTFLSLFVVIVGGTAAYRYFVNQQVGHAVKAILGALVIMTITFWFYSNATQNIKWLNDRGAELEGIASSANVLVTSDEFDTNEAYSSKEGLAVLENQLFNLMIKRPYLLLHYGSTKESEIVSEDPNRVDKLLEIKPYTEEGKEQRKIIIKNEVEKLENKYITPEFSGERFGFLLVTLISTVALSIPILLLGIFKFLLQVWFLALVIFTGIPLVLGLIPSYSETALNHFKKIIGVLLMKAGLVLLIAVITGLVTLLYESVKVTNGVEGYAFVVFLIVITMWGLFKYRSEIFEVASAGMVQGQQTVERATSQAFNKMGDFREKTFRMVDKGYQRYQQNQRQKKSDRRQEGATTATPNAAFTQDTPQRSRHRQAGQNPSVGKGQEAAIQATGKNGKSATAAMVTGTGAQSASRNPGAAIVHLDDYKKGKDDGSTNKVASGNVSQQQATPKSDKRNAVPPSPRQQDHPPVNVSHQEATPKSEKRNAGPTPPRQQEHSSSRNPVNYSEQRQSLPHQPIDPNKPITKWEADQQIKARRGDTSGNGVQSAKRDPKPENAKPERKTQQSSKNR
ncbi:hypothetical protein E2K98_24930 [Bacillus salipaludis]|uniref:Uncharacterized protein n=1 Tax=Bacillus salipaludis TaxID=2547811 RepID=A0A4R5VJU5_9BACI|nr:hypothetical protein [Bacillus salipaludis]TDK58163.1 hypothetical protein E2K98_24930 [Bacillus salipaludis]